jgi:ABC-type lipoprotein release transport system permease subunit
VASLESEGLHAVPRIPFPADLIFFKDPFPEDGFIPARVVAIHPEKDGEVFRLEETLVEGEWLQSGVDGLVLGLWAARDIGADVGSWITVSTLARDGFPQVFDLEVVGILNSPNPEVNGSGVYMPLDIADDYLAMDGTVPVVHIRSPGLMPLGGVPEASERVVLPQGTRWYTWEELAADYVAMMDAETSGSTSIIMLILIIAAVGISNTMLMAVLERRREVGMMRSLGMNDRHIRRLFLWESAGIGAAGSILGVGIGALINIPMVNRGLDFTFFFQENTFGYRTAGVFYGSWHWQGFLYAFILGIGLSVLVAMISIRRILRIGIVESLRFD